MAASSMARGRMLVAVVAVVLAAAAAAAAAASTVAPVLLWSNTRSLEELGSTGPGEIVKQQRFAGIVARLVLAEPGDFLVISDGPLPQQSQARSKSHLKALKPALLAAESQVAYGNVVDEADTPTADAVVTAFVHNQLPFQLTTIDSQARLAALERSVSSKPVVYTIDLSQFSDAEAALQTLLQKFSPASAPFVAVYASAPSGSETQDTRAQRYRGRELRSVSASEAGVLAVSDGTSIFDIYTFVSPAIWMGSVALFIVFLILIPAILCTMDIQTPTQFEKKPLLNAVQ